MRKRSEGIRIDHRNFRMRNVHCSFQDIDSLLSISDKHFNESGDSFYDQLLARCRKPPH